MKQSERWIKDNFDYLVEKYGGKYVGIVGNQIIGADIIPGNILESAKKQEIDEELVSLVKIPTQDELVCIL